MTRDEWINALYERMPDGFSRASVGMIVDRVIIPALPKWQPIETAPKDRPILAWCDHEVDAYFASDDGSKLTLYAAHAEGLSHAPTGYHLVEWGGAWGDDTYEHQGGGLPDWWFVAGSEFEVAANPTHWMPLQAPPEGK